MPANAGSRWAARRVTVLVAVWAVAVPVAAALGVLALRTAGGDASGAGSTGSVLTAAEAAALATSAAATPSATSQPSASATDPEVTQARVPGAVLGLRCAASGPVLVWSVPDPGWQVDEVEPDDGGLRIRLESDDDEVRVRVACVEGAPTVVEAVRHDDD